jgi:hypothetical protein
MDRRSASAAGLAPGAAITSSGVQYNWPGVAAGQPDNIIAAGQVIAVSRVAGATELGVMGSATNGPSRGTLTITYTDGTTQTATLGFTDWTSGTPSFGNGTAAAMSRWRTQPPWPRPTLTSSPGAEPRSDYPPGASGTGRLDTGGNATSVASSR